MINIVSWAQLFKNMTISSRLISTKALIGVLTVVFGVNMQDVHN